MNRLILSIAAITFTASMTSTACPPTYDEVRAMRNLSLAPKEKPLDWDDKALYPKKWRDSQNGGTCSDKKDL